MYRVKQFILMLGDLFLLFAGLIAVLAVRFGLAGTQKNISAMLTAQFFLALVAVVILFILGLYDIGRMKPNAKLYRKIAMSSLLWVLAGVIYFYLNPDLKITPKTNLVANAVVSFSLITLWRIAQNRLFGSQAWQTNLLFIGYSPEVKEILACIAREPGRGFTVTGVMTADPDAGLTAQVPFISLAQLQQELDFKMVNVIVLGPEFSTNAELLKTLYTHLFKKLEIITLAELYETIFGRIPPFIFSEAWFLTHLREQQKKIYDRFRILLDYIITILIALIFIVTIPLLATLIRLSSPGPVFFKQRRVGRLGRHFTMYKYRTMRALTADGSAEVNGPQFAGSDDNRITFIGRIMRRMRIDELPQCINILNGDMALIGPRPERPEFVEQLTEVMPFYSLRHLIKPGLMGWAQLHENYFGTIPENLRKLEYDLYYIKNRGALLDLVILLRTVAIVAGMKGR